MGKRKGKELIIRYLIFIVGLFIASMGVAFSAKAGLGTSPVASVPYSVSLVLPLLSFGTYLNILSVIQITIQVLIQRKNCNPLEILVQTVLAFAYGFLTDFSCYLIRDMVVEAYIARFLVMLLGCLVLALGLWIQYKGGVAMLPGEAMNKAIAGVTGKKYENIKIFFDIFYIVLSALITLVFLRKLVGVREGSFIAAIAIGNIMKLFNKAFDKIVNKKH